MPSDTSSDLLVDGSAAAHRTSAVLAIVAAVVLVASGLLTSPPRFQEQHQQDTSLLKPVITILGFGREVPTDDGVEIQSIIPTARGVEVRNLIFYMGAAILALVAALRLVSTDRRPRLSGDDLLDLQRRAASPYFWWLLLCLVSLISSTFSHAPDVCKGQTVIRFLHLAWWWPLAALLTARHARRLVTALLVAAALTAGVGLWYYLERKLPDDYFASTWPSLPAARLVYPIGNATWLAACLLPGPFIVVGLCLGPFWERFTINPLGATALEQCAGGPATHADTRIRAWRPRLRLIGLITVFGVILLALVLARSRSAGVGLAAGSCAMIFFATRRTARRAVLLTTLLLAIGGAFLMQSLRSGGVMGQRAHSVRARLDHEWPYAMTLFFEKPVAGHGDGSYALLAGRYARDQQLDDPGTMGFDEWSWVARAHNEFLQLSAELGIVGLFAFIAAVVLTLHRAVRTCDADRGVPGAQPRRLLVIALAGAFVALLLEEAGSPAMREPGLPPIFLTVWAALAVMVRPRQPIVTLAQDDRPLGNLSLRMGGVVAGIAAVILGYFAIQDWRGARARHEGMVALEHGRTAEAIEQADLAGTRQLDPFQRILGRLYAIWSRSAQFSDMLAASDAPPTDRDLVFAQDALARLSLLDRTAPRFLKSARLRADLYRNLSLAHKRRAEPIYEQQSLAAFVRAWERHREDEPFRLDVVEGLWEIKPAAPAVERLLWLRCLLRDGEINPRFFRLFQRLNARDDFNDAMNDLLNVAERDREQSPAQWTDRLAPETFRIAALATAYAGYPAEAADVVKKAEALYAAAGPRLFAAHAAALHEQVRYAFDADPTANHAERLECLARAYTIFRSPADAATPLRDAWGHTRFHILLAAGRESEARAQLALLDPSPDRSLDEQVADGYFTLAGQFALHPRFIADALRWTQQGTGLAPDLPRGHLLLTRLHLYRCDDPESLQAARQFLDRSPDLQAAYAALGELQAEYPGSTMWTELRRQHPGLLPLPPLPP